MGSFRFGQVAEAASQGLGLFAGHKAEEERDRVNKQWDLALADMREKQAGERQAAGFAHSEALAETASTAATERHAETQQRIVSEGELGRTARREEFDQKQVSDAEEMLFKRMDALREERAEAIDNSFGAEGTEEKITRRYQGLMDDMILGHVVRLGEAKAPGYEIDNAGALESKFLQMGMDTAGAKQHAKNIGESLWPAPVDPNAAPQFVPTGNYDLIDETGQRVIGGTGNPNSPPPEAVASAQGTSSPQQQTAAGSRPLDMVPSQGSGIRELFGHDMIRNPDGSPKFPMKQDAPAMKAWDWFRGPSNEMFGNQ